MPNPNETLLDRIKRHRGLKLLPHPDSVGRIIVGWGRNLTDFGVSEMEATIMLKADIAKAQQDIHENLPWLEIFPVLAIHVVVEMVLDMDINVVMQFRKFLEALHSRRYTEAAAEMLKSQWHKESPTRCEELSQLVQSLARP